MKMNPRHYARMLSLIVDDGMTLTEMADETGLFRVTVAEYMTALHAAGVVRIVGWERITSNRAWTPVYQLGKGTDRRKPRPLTHAERQQRHRDKRKAMQQFAALTQMGTPQ